MMTPFPEDAFVEAVKRVVKDNVAYVPPFGTGGSLYIRPLLFGSGARIGLNPADEYTLLILVIPVGDYYKGGLSPVSALVIDDFDRAAPRGVGNVKVSLRHDEKGESWNGSPGRRAIYSYILRGHQHDMSCYDPSLPF